MKIGFVAMSGVRACDPELVRLGMTLPGFVKRGKVIASLPTLGLLTLAGMTPQQHSCEYHEVRQLSGHEGLPDRFDLVAISSLSTECTRCMSWRTATGHRRAGGPGRAARHGAAGGGRAARRRGGDWRGRAGLARGLARRRSRAAQAIVSRRRNFPMADAPIPAFELLDPAKYNRLVVQASRVCPLRCEFCASSILLTRRYKQKPIEKVLAEVDRIRSIWRRPFIEFGDDNAFVNRRYWKQLLPELARRKIRWFAETDLSVHEDAELLRLMRESGCAEVLIGFESPGEEGLRGSS